MASYKKIQNRLHKIKVEIMELEESIKKAESEIRLKKLIL